jgi:zinc transport system ATP-binding protein
MSDPPVIEMKGVTFGYDGGVVLHDVRLEVERYAFASVVGPNGGGKSTLLKLILGLLRPREGTVEVLGRSPAEARPRVGYLPQHADLDPRFPVTVLDVALTGRLQGRHPLGPFRRADRDRAVEALASVGADSLARRPFGELSGGQRQRVLIARALAAEPELLLLDEPAANLDPAVQEDLYDLLAGLTERMTVLVVSHDVGFVSKHVDRAICVNRTVAIHETSAITGELARALYTPPGTRLVHHDHAVNRRRSGDAGRAG